MTNQKLSDELLWRGQIKDMTFDDPKWLDNPGVFYLGSDASSNSLTIGNLAIYMLARRLRKHGWKAVMLFGGATSLIGDPGGKEQERELQSKEVIHGNIEAIKLQVQNLFKDMDFTAVNNIDWFKDIGYLDFLRDVGKHYSMTELLQRDFIVSRIGEGGSGISYAEFSYSLIQGYDYWQLYKAHNVTLQIGGSDQWGNMLSGVPLIRKKENKEVHALSIPLVVNKSTGVKFGKSENGAVWLDSDLTSVYKFYQFWLNLEDEDIESHLKVYTELDKSEIQQIMTSFEKDRASRLAQKTLAYEVTALVHGEARADSIKRVTEVLFDNNDYQTLKPDDFILLKSELPFVETDNDLDLVKILVESGLASSNTDARRFISEKAIYINGVQIGAEGALNKHDSLSGWFVIRRGKNSIAVVCIK